MPGDRVVGTASGRWTATPLLFPAPGAGPRRTSSGQDTMGECTPDGDVVHVPHGTVPADLPRRTEPGLTSCLSCCADGGDAAGWCRRLARNARLGEMRLLEGFRTLPATVYRWLL